MKAHKLTEKQQLTLEAIRRHVRIRGYPPTRAEIAREIGVRHQTSVDSLLTALDRKGWIRIRIGVDRGITLLREGAPILNADELPEVSAGTPRLAEEEVAPPRLDTFDSIVREFQGKPDYFLRVHGDSMDKVGFATGDIVAVQREREPREGDVVVARMGDAITLKRYHRVDDDHVELHPESANGEHQKVLMKRGEDVDIVGVVVGAIVGSVRTEYAAA